MKLAMPRAGFSKHCAAKLGENLYIIGGGYRSNRIHQLNLNTKQLKLTRNILPEGILEDRRHNWYDWHSCATFQKKIWICGPRYASRRSKRIVNKCWTFDGQTVRAIDNLSVKFSFFFVVIHSLVCSFIVENDYCCSQRGRRRRSYCWWYGTKNFCSKLFSLCIDFYIFVRLSFIETEHPGSVYQTFRFKYRQLKLFGMRTPRNYSFLVVTLQRGLLMRSTNSNITEMVTGVNGSKQER